ncbi:MAG: GH3 auxin-responsive promoter family protein, partial [Planctomycetes bacterium]|nr:GH3 auxin-responsive promoter family protein [Planctomycetota bacterium]
MPVRLPSLAWCLNTAWMWACRKEWRKFRDAARDPAAAQSAVLARILTANRHSRFGLSHGFATIATPREYRERVPLSDYNDYLPAIDEIASGAHNVLTSEPVLLFEPTSGSTSGVKLIPYTHSLRREFQRMIATWIYDLFRGAPAIRHGRAYWSISPALGERVFTAGGVAIGFDDDTAYLGGLARRFVRRLLAVPPQVARLTDVDDFRYATLLALVRAKDLALISIWSPTFLTALFERLEEWGGQLCADLRSGRSSLPSGPGRGLSPTFLAAPPDPDRARELQLCLTSESPSLGLRRLWPQLALIS